MAETLKVFQINLDMKKVTAQAAPIDPLVVGDNGNLFEIAVSDGGVPVDLTGCLVIALFALPDGTTSARSTTDETDPVVIGGENNNVIAFRPNSANYAVGLNTCRVQVYSGENAGTLVTSASFNFNGEANILNDETIQRDPSYPVLVGLINQTIGAADRAEEAAASIENVVAEEESRVAAEAERESAENERIAAEAERETKIAEVYTAYQSGALKGDKGDKGEKGDKGDSSGVQTVNGIAPTSGNVQLTAAIVGAIPTSEKGLASGVASLDASGKVSAPQASSEIISVNGNITIGNNHAGRMLKVDADCTVAIPNNASIPINTEIEIYAHGDITCSITSASGVYIAYDGTNSTERTLKLSPYGVCALKKVTTTTWKASGEFA